MQSANETTLRELFNQIIYFIKLAITTVLEGLIWLWDKLLDTPNKDLRELALALLLAIVISSIAAIFIKKIITIYKKGKSGIIAIEKLMEIDDYFTCNTCGQRIQRKDFRSHLNECLARQQQK